MSGKKNKSKNGKQGNRKRQEQHSGTVMQGKIEVTRSGMAFVTVAGMDRDVKIYPEHLNTALNGDEVKIELIMPRGRSDKRAQGIVREVIQRKQNEFVGRMQVKPQFAFLVPDNQQVPVDIFVPIPALNGAQDGDKARVRVIEWNGRTKNPVGEVVSILTYESANELAMQEILTENGFPLEFPDEAAEQAARISDILDKKEIARREDMREVLTFTIDPADAKDFDDAISIKALKGGYYEVGVHIADVSYYVSPDSPLDQEAYNRATSVYLPDRVLPMLPEHLSNGLCSLRPNEDKFTFSAVFMINKAGKVKDYRLGRTVTHSDRRFTYEEVQEILEGNDGDYADELRLLDTIAKSLRKERFDKGAINFSSTEIRFKLDEEARPIGIMIKESKDAHKLIEELMLLANRYVATHVSKVHLKDQPLPFPYRVHDVPNEEKLAAFATFAARFGYKLNLNSPDTIAASFNEMLQAVQGKPEQHVLETLGIRTMAKATYTTENVGHYGLGFDYYCHFTSPIRRYPDVLVHRILADCLNGQPKAIKQLEAMCRHCSEQERHAMDAERTANKYKQVELMQQYVGETFEAVISGVAAFGFWAETIEHKCEGMVQIDSLMDYDQFEFSESDYALIGQRTGLRFTIGDKVKVTVIRTDLDKRQIDYEVAEMPETKGRKPRSSKASAKADGPKAAATAKAKTARKRK